MVLLARVRKAVVWRPKVAIHGSEEHTKQSPRLRTSGDVMKTAWPRGLRPLRQASVLKPVGSTATATIHEFAEHRA